MKDSFSSRVKKEISQIYPAARHCLLSELAAFVNQLASIKNEKLVFYTENVLVAQKIYGLLAKVFDIKGELIIQKNVHFRKHGFIIEISEKKDIQRIIQGTSSQPEKKIDPLLIKSTCCKRAYIRGAFLASGSMTDPKRNYHLEFVLDTEMYATELMQVLCYFNLSPKIVERKSRFVLYLKEGDQIVDALNIMGAHVLLLELENLRIIKGMRNDVNRLVNCETANLKKTVTAAVKQIEDIHFIDAKEGLEKLPPHLYETAILRLELPEASLKELGERMDPPVSKSGINHRLRNISKWAKEVRETK